MSGTDTVVLRHLWRISRALKPFFTFLALSGEEAWRIPAVKVYVTEHSRGAVISAIIDLVSVRTCKVLESFTTRLSRVLGSLALTCDNCVVHELKVHRASCEKCENMN